jgi:HAD superfamily hydrolase (TIGR01450 family)
VSDRESEPGETAGKLCEKFDAIYFDLDGVLYRGVNAVDGAAEAVNEVILGGCGVAYVTNNASRTPDEVAFHLVELGIPANASEVVTSSQVAVEILQSHVSLGERVFVVGGVGVEQALSAAGYAPSRDAKNCVAVVQGFGPEVSWRDLAQACYLIQGGAIWIATNLDSTFPTASGIAPGNGSFVDAVRNAVGRDPDGVGGKPDRAMLRRTFEVTPGDRPLLVGDRYDTDIAAGIAAEIPTMLVLSGVSDIADVWRSSLRADYLCESVQGLVLDYPEIDTSGATHQCGQAIATYDALKLRILASGGTRIDRLRAADSLKWSLLSEVGLSSFTHGRIALDLGAQSSVGA